MSAFFSPRMGRIKHSPSNATSQRVRELCAEGRDIIGLTIGEPDFPTPDNVKRCRSSSMRRSRRIDEEHGEAAIAKHFESVLGEPGTRPWKR